MVVWDSFVQFIFAFWVEDLLSSSVCHSWKSILGYFILWDDFCGIDMIDPDVALQWADDQELRQVICTCGPPTLSIPWRSQNRIATTKTSIQKREEQEMYSITCFIANHVILLGHHWEIFLPQQQGNFLVQMLILWKELLCPLCSWALGCILVFLSLFFSVYISEVCAGEYTFI